MPSRFLACLFLIASSLVVVFNSSAVAALAANGAVLAPGSSTTCAVEAGGNAYCWGDNAYGQIGDGTTTSHAFPTLVSGGYTWASISTAYDSSYSSATTCGVTSAGVGYCWGSNTNGNIGDGTTTQRVVPTAISGGYTWKSLSVGWDDVCGVTTTGVGYCWGWNVVGEDGDGSGAVQHNTPSLVSGGYTWSQLSVADGTTCGTTTAGVGYCWGYNNSGQIGDNTNNNSHSPVAVLGGYTWASISSGGYDSCGVTTAGAGYCWGGNNVGEIGDGTTTDRPTPTAISGNYTWATINVGWAAECGVTTTGAGYCWGFNSHGALGDNTTTTRTVPTPVSGGYTWTNIYPGEDRGSSDDSCGLTADGKGYCWGYDFSGQIGDGGNSDRLVPYQISLMFAASANTTLSVTVDPTFTFTVANQGSVCNGESNFVGGAGSATTVALGHLAAGANVSGGQALSVAGNSGGGFAVYVAGTQASQNLRSASHNWTDVTGTYASPAVLGAGERFGYTYKDSTSSSSVTNPASAKFIALTNATTNTVMGSMTSESGGGCVSYDAQTSASTPAASYAATIVYTAVPAF